LGCSLGACFSALGVLGDATFANKLCCNRFVSQKCLIRLSVLVSLGPSEDRSCLIGAQGETVSTMAMFESLFLGISLEVADHFADIPLQASNTASTPSMNFEFGDLSGM